MKKSLALVLALMTVLFCFAGCNKYKGTEEIAAGDGQTHYIVTERGGGLATNANGDFVEAYTDADGKKQTMPVDLSTALVYNNTIYLKDFRISLPEGWSNNKDNSSYGQANIVDNDGNLITIYDTDRTVADQISTANLIVNTAKEKYKAKVVSEDVTIAGKKCPFRSFCIPNPPEGTNPYTAYIIMENNGTVLNIQIESAKDLTGKLDNIISTLSTIQFT